jgi:hypothetical protein
METTGYEWLDKAKVDDIATWPTKATLRQELGWQDRTVERWVKKGHLKTVNIRPQGLKSFPAYNPDDVRAMLSKIRLPIGADITNQPVIPAVPTPRPTTPTVRIPDKSDIATLVQSLEFLADTDIGKVVLSAVSRWQLSLKTILNMKESVALTGYSNTDIKACIKAGILLATKGKGGPYKIKRTDLETIPMADYIHVTGSRLPVSDTTRHSDTH